MVNKEKDIRMIEGKKHLPQYVQNRFIKRILKNNLIIILTYIVFQSMLHTNKKETVFKISITLIFSFFLMIFFDPFTALLIGHLSNAIFNGHIPAMLIHMGFGNKTPAEFLEYVEKMYSRISNNKNIQYAYAYGSLSRGNYKVTSDIDIRLVPQQGKWIAVLIFIMIERSRALFNWFPLDIYAFEKEELFNKMRSDEKPIEFKKTSENVYDDVITFNEFEEIFKQRNMDNI